MFFYVQIVQEPVFRELIGRIVTKIDERASIKLVRRVLGQPIAILSTIQ